MYIETGLNEIRNKHRKEVQELEQQKEVLQMELLEAITAEKCEVDFCNGIMISNIRKIDDIKSDLDRVNWKIMSSNKMIEFLKVDQNRQIIKDEFEKATDVI